MPDPIDLSEPGWNVQEGNTIWKSSPEAEELITDFIFAKQDDGRVFLQVSKDILPMITVHILEDRWVIESPVGGRSFQGRGALPRTVIWAQLAAVLSEQTLHSDWTWNTNRNGGTLNNERSGENAIVVFQ